MLSPLLLFFFHSSFSFPLFSFSSSFPFHLLFLTLLPFFLFVCVPSSQRLKFIRGDLRDRQSVETLLKEGVEGVLHLAAMSRVVWCEFKKTECIESNVDGTHVLLSSMLEAISPFSFGEEGQRKGEEEGGRWTIPWLVFASSREVYGGLKAEDMPVSEETLPKALNVYGQTKVDDEDIIRDARLQPLRSLSGLSSSNKQAEEKPKSGGEDDIYRENEREGEEEEVSYLTAVILRFSNVYGSIHDHPDRLIPALVRNALRNLPLVIEGGDNKRMDFTNVQGISSTSSIIFISLSLSFCLPPPPSSFSHLFVLLRCISKYHKGC
jgi:hypothetical protein